MDIAIVGAGPIGLFIASHLAKRGYDVVVFEEHSDIGNPSHCSGLFSTHIFEITGDMPRLHAAKRAEIVSPSGKVLKIGDRKIHGYVVDRVEFDRAMGRKAIRNGVEIHLKERVRRLNYPEIVTSRGRYRAKLVIGADGINSVVRKAMNVRTPKILGAAQVIAKTDYEDKEEVRIFVGNHIAPGFFAWSIPLFSGFSKVGLGSYGNSWLYLKRLLKKMNLEPVSISGGGIPMGVVEKTYSRGMLIVGDAAGHVKATSGGGVYPGLRASLCAIKAAEKAMESGDFSENSLKDYELCWKKDIGKELNNAVRIHRFYRKITDEEFDKLIDELSKEEMLRIINEYGDIDYPSRVAWKLVKKNPRLFKYLSIALRERK